VNAWRAEFEKRRAERERRQQEWVQEREKKEAQLAAEEAERRRASEAWDSQFEARLAACRRERQSSVQNPRDSRVSSKDGCKDHQPNLGRRARTMPLISMEEERERRRQRWDEDHQRFREAVQQIESITASWPVATEGCEGKPNFSSEGPAAVYG